MGQNASKVASKAAKNINSRIAQAETSAKQSAVNEVRRTVPTGNLPPPKSSEYQEMPADLIKFINDVGPLKRKDQEEEKQARKKREPREHKSVENEGPSPKKASQRQRTSMRLAENIEGFETLRSTSFSTKEDAADPGEFGAGDVVDMFHLISLKDELGSAEKALDVFYEQHKQEEWDDQHIEEHKRMLRNVLEFIELPTTMRDTDDSLVGCWPGRVAELEQLNLVKVPNTVIIPVLQDLHQAETSEKEG